MKFGRMGPSCAALLFLAGALTACGSATDAAGTQATAPADPALILATTTSTQDSGLLDALVPAFERASGYRVKTIAIGSGQAIELGRRGEADVVLAHSPDAEKELMASGRAGQRRVVMHNDFIVIGPPDDPAGIKGLPPVAAMKRIALARAPFVSRGDDSGTNKLEIKLWDKAGIRPAGSWYQKSGQGMGATIQIADQKQAYTIADRGTYLTSGAGRDLPILVQGSPDLLNVYHVIDMTTEAGPRVNQAGARAFAGWIVSPAAQRLIGSFGVKRYGRPLFVPDAGKTDAQIKRAA